MPVEKALYQFDPHHGQQTRPTFARDDLPWRWLFYGAGSTIIFGALVILLLYVLTCQFGFELPLLDRVIRRTCPVSAPLNPPTITKSFSPDHIEVNKTSTLTFTLSNANSVALTVVTFTDWLPPGLQVAPNPSADSNCGGTPTWSPDAGDTTLYFGSSAGGTIPPNSSCNVSVNIMATAVGTYQNMTGYVSSANGGINTSSTGSATASVMAIPAPSLNPPRMTEAFSPDSILLDTISTLTFKITNPNPTDALSGLAFSDSYPEGLQNTAVPEAGTTCTGGTVTAPANGNNLSLSGGTIPADGSCTVTVKVTSASDGSYTNTSGGVSSIEAGSGEAASATLMVGGTSMTKSITLLKQVAASTDGPWSSSITVRPGDNIYYQFTITGDASFSSLGVTDPDVSTAGCSWPATLPVGAFAICVVGPIPASADSYTNTATAFGTYNNTVYTSEASSATYQTSTSSVGLSLYLPADLQTANSYFQAQLDEFAKTNPDPVTNIGYYSDLQNLREQIGNGSAVVALNSADVVNFVGDGLLRSITSLPNDRTFVEESIARNTVDGQVYAYPWQRRIHTCPPEYLGLAIFAENTSTMISKASELGAFLSNETNQLANFRAFQWYPTLSKFYSGEQVPCEVPQDPGVQAQAVAQAQELAVSFQQKFDIKISPPGAQGFDAGLIGGQPGQLAGMIAPVLDEKQEYTDRREHRTRQVMGIFSIYDDRLALEISTYINKGTDLESTQSLGQYMLACDKVNSYNCIAVTLNGEEFLISTDSMKIENDLQEITSPSVVYEEGSYRKCFKVFKRRICIRVFKR